MAAITGLNTTTTDAVSIPENWDSLVQRAREDNYVAARVFMNREVESGDKVHFPKSSIKSAVAHTEGDNLFDDLAAETEGEVVLTLDKEYTAPFFIPNRLSEQSAYDLMVEEMWSSGQAIAAQIDTDILAESSNWTTTPVGTDNVAITYGVLTSAKEALSTLKVPTMDRSWIFSFEAEKDLLDLNVMQSIDYTDTKSVVTGKVAGTILGSPVYFTNNLPAGAAGTKNIYAHREAIVVGMQRNPKVETQYKLEYLGTLGNVSALYGVEAYRLDHGIIVQGR